MNWLQEQIRNAPAPELILHLGAGLCNELPVWQHSGARRIVLVEPNPELLPDLRRRTEGMDQVEIIEAAVAPEAGRGDLHLFNFPLLSSLRKPTALYQSLPGLQQVGRATVELMPIKLLLGQLDMDCEGENWLVIDTPGEEANILQTLEQIDCLHRFARVFITAGIEPLHEGAQSASELLSLLELHGFEPVSKPDYADADWPRHHLRLDRMALECERLRNELAQTRENHKSELEALRRQLSEAEMAREEASKSHQAQLEATRQKLEEAEKESAVRVEKFETALAEKEKEASKLQSQVEQLQSRLSTAESELKSTQQKNDDLQQACRKLEQDNARKEELIDEEFLKAESQLELIKELVFRDKKV